MKIDISFFSLNDLSDISKGKAFLEILLAHNLIVEKVDSVEPIRKSFYSSMLSDLWRGEGNSNVPKTCYFLFKGSRRFKFWGMVTWSKDLLQETKIFNSIHLSFDVPAKHDVNDLIRLADELFSWSEAVYGHITESSRDQATIRAIPGGLYFGLPGLMWTNYFGPEYLSEPDFCIPNNSERVGHGVRVSICDAPTDSTLSNVEFLCDKENEFGEEWFWRRPRKKKLRVPSFNHSALQRENQVNGEGSD